MFKYDKTIKVNEINVKLYNEIQWLLDFISFSPKSLSKTSSYTASWQLQIN